MFGFDLPLWIVGALGLGRKAVSGLFNFFTTKPGVYILVVGLIAGSIWWNGRHGYALGLAQGQSDERLRAAQVRAAAYENGLKDQTKLDAGMANAAERAGYARGLAGVHTITITREIPTYVTAETDAAFAVPCGVYRLHEAAVNGTAPEAVSLPAGLTDGAACPLKASDLIGIVVWNYGIDHEKDAQITGLQDLARTLAAAVSK